jgi:hypothetical protein
MTFVEFAMLARTYLNVFQSLALWVVLAIMLILQGCGGGGSNTGTQPPPTGTTEAVINNNVKPLASDGSLIIEQAANSVTLSGQVPALKVGDVIISKVTSENQDTSKLLLSPLKVTAVSQVAGKTIVQTSPAGLTDVFQRLKLQISKSVSGFELDPTLPPGVTMTTGPAALNRRDTNNQATQTKAITIGTGAITFNFANVEFGNSTNSLKLSGGITYEPSFEADINIENQRLQYLKLAYKVNQSRKVTLKNSLKSSLNFDKPLTKPLKKRIYTVIPGTVIPLELVAQADLSLNASLSGTGTQELKTELPAKQSVRGVEYRPSTGWQRVVSDTDAKETFTVGDATTDMSGEAKLQGKLGEKLRGSLIINRLAGPFAQVELSEQLSITACAFRWMPVLKHKPE